MSGVGNKSGLGRDDNSRRGLLCCSDGFLERSSKDASELAIDGINCDRWFMACSYETVS